MKSGDLGSKPRSGYTKNLKNWYQILYGIGMPRVFSMALQLSYYVAGVIDLPYHKEAQYINIRLAVAVMTEKNFK